MKYRGTRACSGSKASVGFTDAVLKGLHESGGLFVPEHIPKVSRETQEEWRELDYRALCYRITRLFIDPLEIPDQDLRNIISESFSVFPLEQVVELRVIGDLYFLELFHGPTLAFKDIALQFLGVLFDYILTKRRERMLVVAATSGDTGSAAISGMAGHDNIKCIVLYPLGRTSRIQQLQMTTCSDPNVECIAIDGTFDDCQSLVKRSFMTNLEIPYTLGAVNSINWARLLIQTTYYWFSALKMTKRMSPDSRVDFCVPTGNFGNVLSGYYARAMGAPICHLIIASNRNDILVKCWDNGQYTPAGVHPTISPSMDIQISSNFERFLFTNCLEMNSVAVKAHMESLKSNGFTLSGEAHSRFQDSMEAFSANETETAEAIQELHRDFNYIMDPHTAVGYVAARKFQKSRPTQCGAMLVCLATAHHAKFYDTMKSLLGESTISEYFPPALAKLEHLPQYYTPLPNNATGLFNYIRENYGSTTLSSPSDGMTSEALLLGVVAALSLAYLAISIQQSKRFT